MAILATGGAGFIGSNFVLDWLAQSDESVHNLDKLTYPGNLEKLAQPLAAMRIIAVQTISRSPSISIAAASTHILPP